MTTTIHALALREKSVRLRRSIRFINLTVPLLPKHYPVYMDRPCPHKRQGDQGLTLTTSTVGLLHEKLVFGRRVRVLAERLAALLPQGKVLDVGCGDGTIDSLMMSRRPDVVIEGIDVLVRPSTHIPVKAFDGTHIPHPDQSFDSVMFVDVLHHTDDPLVLLREAKRVGRSIVIKDHYRDGLLANETLRFMDWVGNAHHGVVLPYNYWPRATWDAAFQSLALKPVAMQTPLGLYPFPASLVFERGLHFVARLEPA